MPRDGGDNHGDLFAHEGPGGVPGKVADRREVRVAFVEVIRERGIISFEDLGGSRGP